MTVSEESRSIAELLRTKDHLLLSPVSWAAYQAILDQFDAEGRRFRHTYDRGRLEVMTRSGEHEMPKEVIGFLIVVLVEEFDRPFLAGGELTMDRAEVERGLEPDQSYWIANAHLIRGRQDIDFNRDPVPDLFVEIEVSRTILDRLGVLAALKVPEVWRCTGEEVLAGVLQPDDSYRWGSESLSFPGIPIGELARFLEMARSTDHLTVIRAFRAWVREQLSKGRNGGAP